VRATALVAVGFLAALTAAAVTGCAVGAGGSGGAAPVSVAIGPAASRPAGSAAGCATVAYRAIRAHERLTSAPAECQALTPSQRNVAVGLAIRMASATGDKSARRRQAAAAAAYVSALISGPPPNARGSPPGSAPASVHGSAPGGLPAASAGSRLGFSESATEVAALLAWLAAAGSGGWIIIRWSRAGGRLARPRHTTDPAAAPPAVIVGHGGGALLGLTIWTLFISTGWAALAWISVGLLAPVAGLGMTVLLSGLPRPRSAAASSLSPTRSGRQPAAIIAAHGLFVLATLLLVLLAAIGA
jgi:hypothetical protein